MLKIFAVTHLSCNMTLSQPGKIRMGPGAVRPRRDVAQVLAELEVLEAVVQELADVPRQVVVTIDEWHFLQQP